MVGKGIFCGKIREGGPDRAIIGIDEATGLFLANQLSMAAQDDRVIRVSSGQKLSGPGWQVFAHKGFWKRCVKGGRWLQLICARWLGYWEATTINMPAYGACRALGIAPKAIERAMQVSRSRASISVGKEIGGIRFVNDSKATNAASALNALHALKYRWVRRSRKSRV